MLQDITSNFFSVQCTGDNTSSIVIYVKNIKNKLINKLIFFKNAKSNMFWTNFKLDFFFNLIFWCFDYLFIKLKMIMIH